MSIWDGTPGSGTQVAQATAQAWANNGVSPLMVTRPFTPSGTNKTYNLALHTNTGTAGAEAQSDAPIHLLVELV